VLDSGIFRDHEDFPKDRILPGYDFHHEDNDPSDEGGHGTKVAGVIAAVINNNRGIAGICSSCRIMPLKNLGEGAGNSFATFEAMAYAADNGADILNMSYSSPGPNQA